MPLLLLCVVLQALSLSQGLNRTDDRTSKSVKKHADHSDKQIELSTLSLSEGCFGVPRALYKNTTVDVTLNLLNAQEKKELALQICERLSCGGVFEHGMAATVHNGTCLADCILRDSKLHNCTTAAKGDCMNATEVICEHQAVQLVGGLDHCAGRVELLHSGNWGTVCDDDFGKNSRRVVCTQLRCGSPIQWRFFGPGTGPIHISQMKCNGSESSLWECDSINTTASNYCGHKEDAGVVCSECVIHQNHTNSHTSLESQSNVQTGICNTQTVPSAVGHQYESLGPRMSSKYGSKFSTRTNRPTHDSDSSTDSDYEYHNSNLPQRLHLKNSRYGNDVVSTSSGERRGHNVEINMDTIQKSGDKPPLAPLSFGAPEAYRQAVDMNDTSSTSSGEFYQNTKADTNNTLQSRKHK
uniref:Si:dkey-242e21.3 n=1 Tax=Cyprinus carpio carpio TaxID=630221 RepID=A0A9J7XCD6_CYPCA